MAEGHKIFISYKYYDDSVFQCLEHNLFEGSKIDAITPRDYVNVLETYIKDYSPHFFKAEEDNNSLEGLGEEQIWEILKTKMFDSTLTIVLVSPKMKEVGVSDRKQWIPWEIQYSLGLQQRKNKAGNFVRSNTNAMMAIVLPDINNNYDYYFENKHCCDSGCRLNKTNILFHILKENTFNRIKEVDSYVCDTKSTIYRGGMHSFIPFYKWCDVNTKETIETAIEHSYLILSQKNCYDICHEID